MRLLILGGTWFLGRTLAKDALARGWQVTSFTRGRSGTPPAGVEHIQGDRMVTEDLTRLAANGPWDATVDTSAYEPGDVTSVIEALGDSAGLYVLMSTVSAYRDWPKPSSPSTINSLDHAESGWKWFITLTTVLFGQHESAV